MPNYGEATYWDERYSTQKQTTFDWLEGWDDLKEILEKHAIDGLFDDKEEPVSDEIAEQVKENTKILNLGCGNSIICEEMYDIGYTQIWNNDISKFVIK